MLLNNVYCESLLLIYFLLTLNNYITLLRFHKMLTFFRMEEEGLCYAMNFITYLISYLFLLLHYVSSSFQLNVRIISL
jgi:hypothetical protein